MGLFSMVFNYLPLLLALYSAWSSGGGYTPLLQFVVTIFAGKMLNSAFTYILQIAFLGAHPLVLAQVMLFPAGIYVIAYFLGCSMHMLGSYALSCFVFPAIRRKAPTAGTPAIAVAILAGVAYVWQTDGISSFFVFILFLQVLPELQRPLWIGGPTKTKLHFALLAVTTLLFAPFATLGAVAVSKPELLTSLSEGQLRTLCAVSNGCPSVDHRDLYAALGLHKYAPISDVRKAYRRLSLENHPDKLVELNLTQEEKEAKVAAFTRAATAYETLSKPGAQSQYDAMERSQQGIRPELLDLVPRCVACGIMLAYWLVQSVLNMRDASAQKATLIEKLRAHIMRKGPLNLEAIGVESRAPLEDYARFRELPVVTRNDEAELQQLRELLSAAGVKLKPPPEGVALNIIRSTRGDPEALRAHILNGGAIQEAALGISRERLDAYASDASKPLIAVHKNDNEDVLRFRELLRENGETLGPMPEGECKVVDVPG